MKIRANCTFTGTRPPRDNLRLRDVTDVTARVNWVVAGEPPQVELIFQSDSSSTLVRMSAEAAKALGFALIEQSDTVTLTLRREVEDDRPIKDRAHRPSRAMNRDYKP